MRQRLFGRMRDRQRDVFCAQLGCDSRRLAMELNGRTLPFGRTTSMSRQRTP